jgi:NTP pyrophosphatase (non-canonical NTP hydrolase)
MSNALTIAEYQAAVDRWINKIGVRYFNPITQMGVLMEEVGEVARLLVRTDGEQTWKKGTEPADPTQELAAELCDVLFCVACLANAKGINLEEALLINMERKGQRDSLRHQENKKLKA